MISRRTVVSAGVAGVVAAAAGCGDSTAPTAGRGPTVVRYGDDPSQFVELSRPDAGGDVPVAVVIHGGFWRSAYDLSLGRPLAASLVANGWAAWNIEYRRVGNGGGYPATLDDVGAAIDALADVDGLDRSRVVTIGHSAGGHLAAWAATRDDAGVAVTAVVAQAGVLDLRRVPGSASAAAPCDAFLGVEPADVAAAYAAADPTVRLPLGVPVLCVHGRADDIVPITQSEDFVAAAKAAGDDARLVAVEGDHFVVIDPASEAWAAVLDFLGS